MDWRNLIKQSVTVGAQLLWDGRYGCNNGRYGCTIVMSYIEINKAVSQWLLTFNLCISVTWSLTCAFHIPCTHTREIIDMHRGVCDKLYILQYPLDGLAPLYIVAILQLFSELSILRPERRFKLQKILSDASIKNEALNHIKLNDMYWNSVTPLPEPRWPSSWTHVCAIGLQCY